ncbi:GlsB/YeaQ/YmgE family stress response membrane protein [Comamonas guangdongensis]|uniref:GlsB/YeaQ/YmgE family stress response membrane protein n=1 Tax=Comamonas guangdongensis TaxID=510515 RepID=A0ABV3ZXQ3_9BURK
MSIIGTVIVGLIVGLIARAIKPGDDSMGWIMTILLGIVGSFVASYLGAAFGFYRPGQTAGWIASVVGAIIVLFIYDLVRGKTKS